MAETRGLSFHVLATDARSRIECPDTSLCRGTLKILDERSVYREVDVAAYTSNGTAYMEFRLGDLYLWVNENGRKLAELPVDEKPRRIDLYIPHTQASKDERGALIAPVVRETGNRLVGLEVTFER